MGFVVVFPCHFVGLSVKETQIATSLSSELDGVAIPSVPVVHAKTGGTREATSIASESANQKVRSSEAHPLLLCPSDDVLSQRFLRSIRVCVYLSTLLSVQASNGRLSKRGTAVPVIGRIKRTNEEGGVFFKARLFLNLVLDFRHPSVSFSVLKHRDTTKEVVFFLLAGRTVSSFQS